MLPNLFKNIKNDIIKLHHNFTFFFRYKLWCKDYRYDDYGLYYYEGCVNGNCKSDFCDWEYCPKLHKIDGDNV